MQAQVTVMASYGIISLGKKLTHNCLSRLRSINEYLVIDWGGKGLRLRQSPSATGVRVGLRVPTPQLASQSLRLRAPGQAPGDCLARPIAPASAREPSHLVGGHYRLTEAPYPFPSICVYTIYSQFLDTPIQSHKYLFRKCIYYDNSTLLLTKLRPSIQMFCTQHISRTKSIHFLTSCLGEKL